MALNLAKEKLFSVQLRKICSKKRLMLSTLLVVFFNTAYRHGEESLGGTIIKMAHDYVGSNNINFLEPLGQFGSRNLVR